MKRALFVDKESPFAAHSASFRHVMKLDEACRGYGAAVADQTWRSLGSIARPPARTHYAEPNRPCLNHNEAYFRVHRDVELQDMGEVRVKDTDLWRRLHQPLDYRKKAAPSLGVISKPLAQNQHRNWSGLFDQRYAFVSFQHHSANFAGVPPFNASSMSALFQFFWPHGAT